MINSGKSKNRFSRIAKAHVSLSVVFSCCSKEVVLFYRQTHFLCSPNSCLGQVHLQCWVRDPAEIQYTMLKIPRKNFCKTKRKWKLYRAILILTCNWFLQLCFCGASLLNSLARCTMVSHVWKRFFSKVLCPFPGGKAQLVAGKRSQHLPCAPGKGHLFIDPSSRSRLKPCAILEFCVHLFYFVPPHFYFKRFV